MEYVILLFCTVVCLYSIYKYKNFYNPIFLFSFIWIVIIGLYSLKLYDIYSVSQQTYNLIFLGILFWIIGSFLGKYRFILNKKRKMNKLNKSVYLILVIFTFTILIISAYSGIKTIVMGGDLYGIRYHAREDILGNGILNIMYNYYAIPVSYLIIHYNINEVFLKRKGLKNILIVFFVVIFSVLTEGGRFILLYVFIDIIILGLFYKKSILVKQIKRAVKKKQYFIIAIMIALFSFITLDRESDILKNIYTYTCGCIPFFDQLINEFNQSHTFGLTSFNGFIRPIFTFLRFFGFSSSLPIAIQNVEEILYHVESVKYIAPDLNYNAFSTLFYDFFIDGGTLGVMLLSSIWGYLCTICYKLIDKNDNKSIVIYLLIAQAILTSMLKFQFVSYHFALSFVYIQIMYKRRKN